MNKRIFFAETIKFRKVVKRKSIFDVFFPGGA